MENSEPPMNGTRVFTQRVLRLRKRSFWATISDAFYGPITLSLRCESGPRSGSGFLELFRILQILFEPGEESSRLSPSHNPPIEVHDQVEGRADYHFPVFDHR